MTINFAVVVCCYEKRVVLPETNRRLLELLNRVTGKALLNRQSGIYCADDSWLSPWVAPTQVLSYAMQSHSALTHLNGSMSR